ncbi:MAG: glycoside hydrolase family protein [Polyangia bacterium]
MVRLFPARTAAGLLGAVLFLVGTAVPGAAAAKTFISYFLPTPTACPVTSQTWGVSGVLPRDTCNGMENTSIPPVYYYWDGKIIPSPDGKYHLFADRWAGSTGFGNWVNSEPIYAVGNSAVIGPYTDMGYAYDNGPDSGDPHKGHNSSACVLPNGTYCLYASEIIPFTMWTSSSLAGPWTACKASGDLIQTNGVPVNFPPGADGTMDSNVSLVVRPDGTFEVIQRHGVIALSTTGICGPYNVQQPTNTYPANEQPPSNLASIFPNRQKHTSDDPYAPSSVEDTYVWAEDPVIWYSGGQYHVLYDYPDDRVGYHLTSLDGIHDWTDQGLAYDPRFAQQLFRTTDGTVDNWYKMERPGVVMEGGHISHMTFAVSDVDKNNQILANTNHGSKVLVMAFDGVTFDAETGVGGAGGAGGSSGTGGRGESEGGAGGSGAGGASGSWLPGSDAGVAGGGGIVTSGGSSASAGTTSSLGTGSAVVSGGSSGRGGSAVAGGSEAGGGSSGSGGMVIATGGMSTGSGGSARTAGAGGSGGLSAISQGGATTANGGGSGCSCAVDGGRGAGAASSWCMATFLGLLAVARRRGRAIRACSYGNRFRKTQSGRKVV